MKKTIIILSTVLFLIALFFIINFYNKGSDIIKEPSISYKNATYTIEGKSISLKDGLSEIESEPNSSSKTTTKYFGNEVMEDFDSDGRQDVAFILTQNTGGSGTFYYVVVALNKVDGYIGSQGLLLGDRIAPQTTEISRNKIIVVNYADRKPSDSFATPPSIGKSIWLKLDTETMQFGEVAQNFEGEADPTKMSLNMNKWNWINTIYNNDTTISPKIQDRFTLTLKNDGSFSATTDCNSLGGNYIVKNNTITFTKMISTLMFCENSQEQDFTKMLSSVQSFLFTSKGELVLNLKLDTGSMIFR